MRGECSNPLNHETQLLSGAEMPIVNHEVDSSGVRQRLLGIGRFFIVALHFLCSFAVEAATLPPRTNWSSIAITADGSKLAAAANDRTVWTSSDYGENWALHKVGTLPRTSQQRASEKGHIAMSSDGVRIALASGADIWVSENSGNTWKKRAPDIAMRGATWSALKLSSDGKVLAALGVGIWISKDLGTSWQNPNSTKGAMSNGWDWESLALSSTGEKMALVAPNGVWLSSDYGKTWVRRRTTLHPEREEKPDESDAILDVAMSASGDIVALAAADGIWLSKNFGIEWSPYQGKAASRRRSWASIASAGDGARLVAISEFSLGDGISRRRGDIWTSDDGGSSWVNRTVAMASMRISWEFVAISADGKSLAALGGDGSIWTSKNFGATWVRRPPGAMEKASQSAERLLGSGWRTLARE